MYTVLILAKGGKEHLPLLMKYQSHEDIEDIFVVCDKRSAFETVNLCDAFDISKVQAVVYNSKNREESTLIGLYTIEEQRQDDPLIMIKEVEKPPLSEKVISVPLRLNKLLTIYE